jgi:thiamine pyrophosphate-dependent acetolactate synthase large subunit-like protein
MDRTSKKSSISGRRAFLKGIAVVGAVAVIPEDVALGDAKSRPAPSGTPPPPPSPSPSPSPAPSPGPPPAAATAPAAAAAPVHVHLAVGEVRNPGSDFMVDVIKSLDIDYVASNPAHSFRGLHESLINYGGNKPEFLLCLHEEVAVAMAHGYYKISGKPMIALMHSSVGLQHAAMAVYNAWCDRVPVLVMGGNEQDAAKPERGRDIISAHSVQDPNVLVRDFTKWDDSPVSLQHFADSFVRAYKLAMTPPCEPVMLSIESSYQQEPIEDRARLSIPRYVPTAPPQGEDGAVREAARLLVGARAPVVVVDRAARSQRGVQRLIELCELLQAPCIDLRARMNFPNTHYLNRQTEDAEAQVARADVIIGLELTNYWGTVNSFIDNNKDGEGEQRTLIRPGTRLISISSLNLSMKSNYQDMQRFQVIDVDIAADAEATLPALIQEVRSALAPRHKGAIASRGQALRAEWQQLQRKALSDAKQNWNALPMTPARLTLELLEHVKHLDWSLVGGSRWMVRWARRLWPLQRHYQYLGLSGGDGRGYELPAAIGAALANREHGRFSINLQSDGALMYTPQALWTAVHHQIPLLTIMMNNRCYQSEVEHIVRVSGWRGRKANKGPHSGPIGTMLENPIIDYAQLARSMGMFASGPIMTPAELGPALRKAIQVVRAGAPALVDVVMQPR